MKASPAGNVKKSDAAPGGPGDDGLPELVRRFRSGEEAAFDDIVKRLTPRLYSLALRSLGSAEAAEEVVQESWVRIYNRMGDLQDPQAFEGWAIRVTLSRIHDEFRSRSRERSARKGLAEMRAALGTSCATRSPPSTTRTATSSSFARWRACRTARYRGCSAYRRAPCGRGCPTRGKP